MRSTLIATFVSLASAATLKAGWYHCPALKGPSSLGLAAPPTTCAMFDVPLCYNGLCTSDKTIEVFVKRIEATNVKGKPKSVWFLQGGPAMASSLLDDYLANFYNLTQGQVNVYTLDQRGVGRSTWLDCPAAGAASGG
ncbi:hypothetical protein As57867_005007, partial [Aphanomyces stellatus]